jgi:hypothetical protein
MVPHGLQRFHSSGAKGGFVMRMSMLPSAALVLCALLVTGATSVFAQGADLTKIERTIAKEPAYKSKPKYCLLVFGPEAKTRVWLVRDGDVLYVDRNGNGDLTEKDELCRAQEPQDKLAREFGAKPGDGYRTWRIGDILSPDGKTTYSRLELLVFRDAWGIELRTHHHEFLSGGLKFADRPQDAPIVHFAGPLAANLHPDSLIRGQTKKLWAGLGTRGLGKGAFVTIFDDKLYNETKLVAEIEFPAKIVGTKPVKGKIEFRRL